jgi:hypothetical protein
MATVTKQMAEQIIAADGYYPGDPRVSRIVRYRNDFDGAEAYALIWPYEDQERYHKSPAAHDVEIVWEAP